MMATWNWRACGAVTFLIIAEHRHNEAIAMQRKQPREHDRRQRMISAWVPLRNGRDQTHYLRGWRFILLNGATGLANVVVLSNVPGYTILAPYAAGNFQGVTPNFGTWATTDHMIGLALGFPIARWLAARFGDYRV
jgi:hypothetical protein